MRPSLLRSLARVQVLLTTAIAAVLLLTLSTSRAAIVSDQCSPLEDIYSANGIRVIDVGFVVSFQTVSLGAGEYYTVWRLEVFSWNPSKGTYTIPQSNCNIQERFGFPTSTGTAGAYSNAGATAAASDSDISKAALLTRFYPVDPSTAILRQGFSLTVAEVTRNRALLKDGFTLTTSSPAYETFLASPTTVPSSMPFVIQASAPGDRLVIYANDQEVFSYELATFAIGDLVFAALPALSASPTGGSLVSVRIQSAGLGQSSLWFPGRVSVDPNDLDRDGVPNASDLCPTTAAGAAVDGNGCSADQRDGDGDGVVDTLDQCPATPLGTSVNSNGCSALQLDADGDGVPNAADVCPNTPLGAAVNSVGCALSQLDSDSDGVNDAIDQCPNTPTGATVNAVGCAASQLDSDGDGVSDAVDKCPITPAGAIVNADGCAASQLDSDGDGVPNSVDQCPNTPAGSSVNAVGCSTSQLDSDGDGVTDNLDACPGTPAGTPVGTNGCPITPPSGKTCDVNGDNFIDYRDIRLILLGIGKPLTSATDPRDANRDGKISLTDAALCTSKCDRYICLPPK